ncbi:hypothetical protein B0A52_02502 [Exophiala mesophila]|uniref:Uncharacterized protein n=1 Tax=Exophiala mesophila TaxID=212818 RepID=A0A438NCV8_EXOME|nr:hypothetical protein B0A52_02502 [Exophiala mesophila]
MFYLKTSTFEMDPDVDKEKPKFCRSKADLAQHLGFSSEAAFDEWHTGKLYHTHWVIFYQGLIQPIREEAKRTGAKIPRSFDLTTVEIAEYDGEISGRARYSRRWLDFSSFNRLDWYAWLFHTLRVDNSVQFNGIFYNKIGMRDHAKNCLLWSVIRFDVWQSSESRGRGPNIEHPAPKSPEMPPRKRRTLSKPNSIAQGINFKYIDSDDAEEEDPEVTEDDVDTLLPLNTNVAVHAEEQELINQTITTPAALSISEMIATSTTEQMTTAMDIMSLEAPQSSGMNIIQQLAPNSLGSLFE